jgi:hypothetical protein
VHDVPASTTEKVFECLFCRLWWLIRRDVACAMPQRGDVESIWNNRSVEGGRQRNKRPGSLQGFDVQR